MNTEERAAAYLIIFLLEESVNKLGRKDSTLHSLPRVPGVQDIKETKYIRRIRNHLVHTPLDYAEGYRLINKYKGSLATCLEFCSAYVQRYSEAEIHEAIKVLLAFYKKNK